MKRHVAEPEAGLRFSVADNASPMTLDGTRNYLVGRRRALLLDPGPSGPGQRRRIRRLAEGRRVEAVGLTHAHPDHAGGAAELADALGVPLLASAEALARLGVEGRALEDGDAVPIEASADGAGAAHPPAGGAREALRALETPGHSRDHLSYWWPARRALFTGDLVLGAGSSLVGHPDGHMGAYLSSLERLADLRPRRIYPGHGDPIEDPVERLSAYRSHRLEREARIRRAVAEGAGTVGEIRDRAYDDLPPELEWAASATVRAHLVHLEEEGSEVPEIAGREADGEGPTH